MGFIWDLLFGDGGGDSYGDEEKWRKERDKLNKYERERRAAAKQRAKEKQERDQKRDK